MESSHTVDEVQTSTSQSLQTQQPPSTSFAPQHLFPSMACSPGILTYAPAPGDVDFSIEESSWRNFDHLDEMNTADMDLMSPPLINQRQDVISEPFMSLDSRFNSFEVRFFFERKAFLPC